MLKRRGLTREAVRAPSCSPWQADAKRHLHKYYQLMPHPFSELFLLRASIAPPQTRKTIPTLFLKEGKQITDLTLWMASINATYLLSILGALGTHRPGGDFSVGWGILLEHITPYRWLRRHCHKKSWSPYISKDWQPCMYWVDEGKVIHPTMIHT